MARLLLRVSGHGDGDCRGRAYRRHHDQLLRRAAENHLGRAYAAAGVADGIIQGVSTAEGVAFQGDEPITFNEAATVLNRVLAVEDVDLAGWYADREAVPSWAAQAVGNMEAVSVLAAGSFGSAAMGETVTRADAAQMLSAAGTLLEGEPAGLFDWLL